jgi:hypothetical protein
VFLQAGEWGWGGKGSGHKKLHLLSHLSKFPWHTGFLAVDQDTKLQQDFQLGQ